MRQERIRNFCIVAHIDHGKSTLADRLIEATKTLEKRQMRDQVLDTMDLERERGITIKLNAVRMNYTAKSGEIYELNLIDTPGHVDFTYEVSRSLAACEGAVLVVDASQGIEAQTLSNLFLAIDAGLEIIPVLNKIDLPAAEPDRRAKEIEDLVGTPADDILRISAKEGLGVPELLEEIVKRVPSPRGKLEAPLRALIFDSYYDRYRGAIPSIRVVDGILKPGMHIAFGAHPDDHYEVAEVGYLQLGRRPTETLEAGEVGFVVANTRGVQDTRVGDTILDADHPATEMLPGYRDIKSMVFAGLYPTEPNQYEELRDALEKLQLNDASLHYVPETSIALGFGFRCGFLGLLHMEIVRERLEREFGLSLITTVPNVEYHVYRTDGTMEIIENPTRMPTDSSVERIEEPYVKTRITSPAEYIGGIMTLGQERRGVYLGMHYLDPVRVQFEWEFPLGEIVLDFYDRLKTISRGYASMDYDFMGYRPNDLVKLDMLLNGDAVDAFSVVIHSDKARDWGKKIAGKLRELIPRQLFEVVIQAAIGSQIIARESVRPLRKDVTAKCYGGDITRKRKLLEKQKEGKKRMKQVGTVEIPQEAFLAVLQVEVVRHIVGVDLGGTNIAVGTVAEDGSALLGQVMRDTPVAQGPDAVVDEIVRLIKESVSAAKKALPAIDVIGVGVGAPGPLHTLKGIVRLAPNLGWVDMPLRDRVSAASGLPATLDNDANCATLGEWWLGAARGAQIVVGITVGTGVGGGVVIDGKLFHGASDVAGEIGHTSIDANGRRCKCGNYGCIEAYSSGPAIAARAMEEVESGEPSSLRDMVKGNLGKITAALVYQAAHDGDALARQVVRETARFLGTGIANIVNILNPDVVVVSGGVTLAGDQLFDPLRREVTRRAFKPAVEAVRIVPGTLQGTAGIYGAVAAFKTQRGLA